MAEGQQGETNKGKDCNIEYSFNHLKISIWNGCGKEVLLLIKKNNLSFVELEDVLNAGF